MFSSPDFAVERGDVERQRHVAPTEATSTVEKAKARKEVAT